MKDIHFNWGEQCALVLFKMFFKTKSLKMFIYFEREEEGGGVGRDTETGRERIPIPGRLHAVSPEPDTGLELMNREIMT